MNQQQAINALNERHESSNGTAFNAGFGTQEVSMTWAAEWLMNQHDVADDDAFEYAFVWHEQLPQEYQTIA